MGWSHALQGPLCLHWGLLCPPLCCIESQTIPLNPLNGPGHLSGIYKSILAVNGLAITPLFMGQPTYLPGPHTGFPSWHKSQRHTVIAPPLQLMNYHSHLAFPLPSSWSKPLISWKHGSFSFKLAKSTKPIYSNPSAATKKAKSQISSSPTPMVTTLRNHLIKWTALVFLTYISIQAPWLKCNQTNCLDWHYYGVL